MSYMLMNPHCFTGEPGNPPEYKSTNSFTCIRCRQEFDLDDDTHFDISAGPVDRDCLKRCEDCDAHIEGADALTDAHRFERSEYCAHCFTDRLCPWMLAEEESIRSGESYLATLSENPL